jgi:hypothetical protein
MLPASQRAGLGASASQHLPPAAQRCCGDGPVAPAPIHSTNPAVGGAYGRAPSVRNGRWFDLHSDGWPAGFASFVARVRPAVYAAEPRAPAVGEAANRHSAEGREPGQPA